MSKSGRRYVSAYLFLDQISNLAQTGVVSFFQLLLTDGGFLRLI